MRCCSDPLRRTITHGRGTCRHAVLGAPPTGGCEIWFHRSLRLTDKDIHALHSEARILAVHAKVCQHTLLRISAHAPSMNPDDTIVAWWTRLSDLIANLAQAHDAVILLCDADARFGSVVYAPRR